MRQPNVSVYGSLTCPDTTQATELLDRLGVPFEFKDVDQNPEYNEFIAGLNHGKRVMPTIRVENTNLINPSEEELTHAVQAAADNGPDPS